MMTNTIVKLVLIAAVSYFVGNISPARILGKIYGVDITREGSGNPGTTNVIRTLGLKAGIITLIVDVFKGFLAVKLGYYLEWHYGVYVAFAFVILGHCFPLLYKMKGGKGVAAAFGAAIALNWPSAVIAAFIALVVLAISKRMSVASIIAAVAYPLLILRIIPEMTIFAAVVAVFIIITHIPNIRRMKAGEEPELTIGRRE